ncbi:MAG: hypothetical protein ABID38_02345 [Candidatus Diapherotrites archaeon]
MIKDSRRKNKTKDGVVIGVKKVRLIKDLFGTAKFKKSAQEIKDEMRAGWD